MVSTSLEENRAQFCGFSSICSLIAINHYNHNRSLMINSQNGRASPGLLLAPIAAQQGWVQGVTNLVQGMTKSVVQVYPGLCLVQGLT